MIRLEKINAENVWEILELSVEDDQKRYVSNNTRSIIEAYTSITANGHAFPFGIYDDDKPVGFLMIGYGVDDYWTDAPKIAKDNYNIWRLMIDKSCQGKGYGREAVKLALEFVKTFPCGPAKYFWTSYVPGNDIAKKLYASFGFEETGDLDCDEVITALKL